MSDVPPPSTPPPALPPPVAPAPAATAQQLAASGPAIQPGERAPTGATQLALPAPATPQKTEPQHHRHRLWPWLVVAAILILGGAGFLVWHHRHAKAAGGADAHGPGQGPASITVGSSHSGSMNVYVRALGTITPITTVTVFSQVTGQVTAVSFCEGQIVTKGDHLLDIDARPYQATVLQAQGTLQHDQGLLAEARMDLQRYRAAFAKGAIARQQLDDQEQLVVQDEGSVEADQGALAYDQVQLGYCHITAPLTGRIGLRLVDSGNVVFSGASTTLAVVTQLQPITVVFSVAEDDLPAVEEQLQTGRTLAVDAFDRSDEHRLESGHLTALDNEVDTTTGTVKFRAELPNAKLKLYPNQFVNARLLLKTLHQATLVPTAAVQHNGPNAFVYVVKDNAVTMQPVTVLTSDDKNTAITGLGPGVQVATTGFDRLENGVTVQVRDAGGKAPGGDASASKGVGAGGDQGGGADKGGTGDAADANGKTDSSSAGDQGDKPAGADQTSASGQDQDSHADKKDAQDHGGGGASSSP